MTTDLIGKHAGIHDSKTLDAMNVAVNIDDAGLGRRAHARSTNRMVQSKGNFSHEAHQLVVGDGVVVSGRIRPPVRSVVVVGFHGFEVFFECFALDDLQGDAKAGQQDFAVVVVFVAKVFRVDESCNGLARAKNRKKRKGQKKKSRENH